MNTKWKNKLLSSGIPLELEVQNLILSCEDYIVFSEFQYERKNLAGEITEFSVDLLANGSFYQSNKQSEQSIELLLPVECKYRSREKIWLFLPNQTHSEYIFDFNPPMICEISDFSTLDSSWSYLEKFMSKVSSVVKGVEINMQSGDVYEKDIRRGVYQLKFALPNLIYDNISNYLVRASNLRKNHGQANFIMPILLTNAPLYILKGDCAINSIEKAKDISDISTNVDYVCIDSRSSAFKYHGRFVNQRIIEEYSKLLAGKEESVFPISRLQSYIRDVHNDPNSFFPNILIVNKEKLVPLLKELSQVFKAMLKDINGKN